MKHSDHKFITRRAIDLFVNVTQEGRTHQFNRYRKKISRGALLEDILPLKTRAQNWHFYRENSDIKPAKAKIPIYWRKIHVNPTSDSIFLSRVDEIQRFQSKDRSDKFFSLIGRAVHHIQDLSTPSHVIPVYHGPGISDSYESYSAKRVEEVLSSIHITNGEIQKIIDESNIGFNKIYDMAAKETLDYLKSNSSTFDMVVNGEKKKGSWNLFWRRNSDLGDDEKKGRREIYSGFGKFGVLGSHFGEREIRLEGGEFIYEIEDEVYIKLYEKMIRKTVFDTIRFLAAADDV